ncbi:MAG: DUF4349 domain-containing protein [Chloroflexota bacterium]|nr:DUF4349 domain-containing protein [Chloroflexota bacterium]
MNKRVFLPLLAFLLVFLVSCSNAADEDSGRNLALTDYPSGNAALLSSPGAVAAAGQPAQYYAYPPSAVPSPFADYGGGGTGLPASFLGQDLLGPEQEPATQARLILEVDSVEGAALQVRSIAASLDGYVERMASSGGSFSPRSDIILKVPQGRFDSFMKRVEFLGVVQYRSLGGEDVTDQHVDLAARLSTLRMEEQGLISLLDRGSSVAELLGVERELSRVRTDIERTQWQLELLERQVDLAAIHVALFPSGTTMVVGPTASFTVEAAGVDARLAEVQQFAADRLGQIDEIYLSSSGESQMARVTFRVYSDDFARATQFIEGQGRVTARELLDRRDPRVGTRSQQRTPNATFQVTYVDSSSGVSPWVLILAIAGILILAGVIAYLMRAAYTRGRRRGSFI